MSTHDNGGPAFPYEEYSQHSEQARAMNWQSSGMNLRDYFAAKAPITPMDAMVACGMDSKSYGTVPAQERIVVMTALAVMRGEYADAMLAERAK